MGNVKLDFSNIMEMKSNMTRTVEAKRNEFLSTCTKELADLLVEMVKDRTPVKSGTLREGFFATDVRGNGLFYSVEVKNEVDYCLAVELGHSQIPGRFVPQIGKRLSRPWVEGRFMMHISVLEMETAAPRLIQARLMAFLKEVLCG